MSANDDWKQAKKAVDDAMNAAYDALHHLNGKVDDLIEKAEVEEKVESLEKKASETMQSVSSTVEQFGKKLNETLNSPELQQRKETLKKQAEDVASRAADHLASGAALVATGLDKAMQALKGALGGEENAAENEEETERPGDDETQK